MRQRLVAIAVTLLATFTHAVADKKPTLVVAGVDGKDPTAHKLADALTAALRSVAGGRYQVKGTPKQIEQAVIAAECKVFDRACATKIGTVIGVDYVLSGEVDKRGTRHILVLALVDVRTKQRVRSLRDQVDSTVDTKRWAKAVYQKLVANTTGDLEIVSNAQRGEILLDGEPVAALFNGRATLTGIAIGTHQLGIRAKGFRPIDIDIDVAGTTRESLLLEPETP